MKPEPRAGQTYLLKHIHTENAFLLLERLRRADGSPCWTALRLTDGKVRLVSEEWLLEESTELIA